MFIQATAVSFQKGAVLIFGSAGIGKSTLALQLMAQGARLIADDGIELRTVKGRLMAFAPETMRGCLALRGLGIFSGWPVRRRAQVRCVIRLTMEEKNDPLPAAQFYTVDDISVPLFELNALDRALDLKVLTAFWVSIGKISLFSNLDMVKQKQMQFCKKRLK